MRGLSSVSLLHCALNHINPRKASHAIQLNRDEIDPPRGLGIFRMLLQKLLRDDEQARAFAPRERFFGRAGGGAAPRAYLDERESVGVARDQIHLAETRPKIAREDAITALFQKQRGNAFAGIAQIFACA
jgi:hypothetical protein